MQHPLNTPFFQRLLLRWALLFAVLFPLSFSFERGGIIPNPGFYTQYFFEKLSRFSGAVFYGNAKYVSALVSDTAGFYLNALNILLLSALGATAWTFFSKGQHETGLKIILFTWARYYLALQLLWYGFDKVFKTQFYLPEPNTLFTPVGQTHRDLLYWTVMGTSRTYTMFCGMTELLAAFLLLFYRTTLMGAYWPAALCVMLS